MTQGKTLREQFYKKFCEDVIVGKGFTAYKIPQALAGASGKEIADFYEEKIKSAVREMKKETKQHTEIGEAYEKSEHIGYNQFGDDLLERLGIK